MANRVPATAAEPVKIRPCWHCRHFVGMLYDRTAAQCGCKGCSRVRPGPEHGCCHWEREPGADDEDGRPGGLPDETSRLKPKDAEAPRVRWAQ